MSISYLYLAYLATCTCIRWIMSIYSSSQRPISDGHQLLNQSCMCIAPYLYPSKPHHFLHTITLIC
jgi:hypothetical protein